MTRARQHFGPELYSDWTGTTLGEITESLEDRLLWSLTGDVADRRALEIGCGEGRLAIELQKRGAVVTGADASADMIAAARTNAAATGCPLDLVRAEATHLPFADGSFDLVLAKTVLCFVGEADDMFAEMARVLRPGGRLVIGELHKWSTWAAQRRIRAWLGSPLWRRGRFRTAGELRRLARGAGLEAETVRGAIYFPRLTMAARLMAPCDDWLSRRTNFGAAFLAMAAIRPASAQD